MAKKNTEEPNQITKAQSVDQLFREHKYNVIPMDLDTEMRTSFIDYAMSVITDRALPDVRDGLKPVHRRILYSMFTQGFTPDKPFRKSATTVGDVLGRFHPHGDAAVYDAMVRLAQGFSMRHPLVDGHGNFGSRDGDPPAAYRYTEARMTRIAMELMGNINKNTVDFKPNYDEHEMEPVVLPANYPNLLVNGSTGIAVGMATHIPPHNLREVIDATIHLMHQPDADLEDLMQFVKAPDFPTGGTILGLHGVRETYATGRGRIVVRALCEIEDFGHNRQRIVVRDLPYMVNKARLIERVADLHRSKRIEGISLIRDESDRSEAVRIVIELRTGVNANVILNQLYKHTALQDNFNANMLALVEDSEGNYEPQVVNLRQALQYYIDHQKEVTTRRTRFDLERAEARRHILEGLRIAIDNIDEVIRIIRAASNEDEAKLNLSARFGFSDRQSQHIVDMRLGRLTGLEREKIETEFRDITERIEYLTRILTEEMLLLKTIEDELIVIRDRFSNDRVTRIDPVGVDGIADEALIEREEVVITLTRFGYVKRQPQSDYQIQHRGGRGITGLTTREEDVVDKLITMHSHDLLLLFTNTGRVYKLKGYEVPEAGRQARGQAIVNLVQLNADEKIQAVVTIEDFDQGGYIVMATEKGLVKKTALSEYNNVHKAGIIAISLNEGDSIVNAVLTSGNDELVTVSNAGLAVRFNEQEVRPTGRNTQGVYGMRLSGDDRIVSMVTIDQEKKLLLISSKGYGKRARFSDFRLQSRGGKGMIAYRLTAKTGEVIRARVIERNEDILMINDDGIIIRVAAHEVPVLGRSTSGVRLMRTGEGEIVDVAIVDKEDEPEDMLDVELDGEDQDEDGNIPEMDDYESDDDASEGSEDIYLNENEDDDEL